MSTLSRAWKDSRARCRWTAEGRWPTGKVGDRLGVYRSPTLSMDAHRRPDPVSNTRLLGEAAAPGARPGGTRWPDLGTPQGPKVRSEPSRSPFPMPSNKAEVVHEPIHTNSRRASNSKCLVEARIPARAREMRRPASLWALGRSSSAGPARSHPPTMTLWPSL